MHAREMRRDPTAQEQRLWRALRDRRFVGHKFRRQQPIEHYILDFFCPESRLSIELDGGNHADPDTRDYDAGRTEFLRSNGIREMRFWNSEVDRNPEGVLNKIAEALEKSERTPSPLAGEEATP
jgi:very-short-patch-repair endonuclease